MMILNNTVTAIRLELTFDDDELDKVFDYCLYRGFKIVACGPKRSEPGKQFVVAERVENAVIEEMKL